MLVVCVPPLLDRCGQPLPPRRLSRELLRHACGRRSRASLSCKMRRCREMARAGWRRPSGEMGLYACVAPMHTWCRVHESSGLLVSYRPLASFCPVLFRHFLLIPARRCGLRAERTTTKYRWLAVSLGSDAETSSTKRFQWVAKKTATAEQRRRRRVRIPKR